MAAVQRSQEQSWLGDYINGAFVKSERPDSEIVDTSPSDLSDTVMRLEVRYDHVGLACAAAKAAFPTWARLPLEERIQHMRRLREIFQRHAGEIATTIARETGKPLWESKTEAAALVSKIDITIDSSLLLVKEEVVDNALPGVRGRIRHRPRGVMAVLGPFNFPAHLPNGHIVPALITGNTVVFKPSEWTPAIGQLMARCFDEAQFPKGVFNLVQGEGETGRRLVADENVDGVLFTGSYETGLKIKQKTIDQAWKLLALEMGGKNAAIVWDDADLNRAVFECLTGSFLSAGQRCSGTSRIILHRSIADRFVDKFYESAKKLKIGHWSEDVFMGPVINADAVEKYIRFQEIASREGAERLMRGKALELPQKGYYVTPSICLVPKADAKSVYQKSEIFGPNVAIYQTDDFDEAVSINNMTGFGLVTSIFSRSKILYEETCLRSSCGVVNWNRSTNGNSSKLPFGGLGKSGNDRPAAHFAVLYCTTPMANHEDKPEFDSGATFPGLSYQPLQDT